MVSIVLNYIHPEDAFRCVASLSRSDYDDHRVIVVDNGSGDEAVAQLRDGLDPTVELIALEDNLGYGGGNNTALRAAMDAGAEFCWVVNPDVVVEPSSLEILVSTARRFPDAGIVGSRILHGGSEPSRIWFDGGTIDWQAAGSTHHVHMGSLESDHPPVSAHDVDYVTGAGMMLRSKMVRTVGLLPDDWFLYFEETAYNVLAQRRGWRTMINTRSRLHHFKRSTGEVPQGYYIYYFIRNRYRFGIEFAGATPDAVSRDLEHFVFSWRDRVRAAAPDWLATYDRLVDEATRDGVALRRGFRDLTELESLTA